MFLYDSANIRQSIFIIWYKKHFVWIYLILPATKFGKMGASTLWIGENGAYPPTKSGSIHPLLSWKSAWNWPKKRSISVQYRLKRWKSLKKTEHCRSPVVREVWWIPKSYRKRSIAVHIGKNESLLSNDLRPKNGALPFTFSIKRQYASGKRSIAVHYSALSCVICM